MTLLVMLGVMGATMLIYRLSQSQFGTQGFSELSIVKRIIAFMVPLMAIGMGVGVPREVARIDRTEMDETKYEILRNSLLITFILIAALFLIIVLFSGFLTELFFGDRKYHYLLFPMAISLQGLLLNSLAYSYFRGLTSFPTSNWLQAVNHIFCPILVIFFLCKDIPSYLTLWGFLSSLVSLSFLGNHIFKLKGKFLSYQALIKVTVYSLRRLPGDIALQMIFVIPPILCAHMVDFKSAGDVAFSLTILTLITVPLSPVSLIMLPKTMSLLNKGRTEILMKITGDVFLYITIGSAILSIILFWVAEPAILIFLPGRKDFDFFILKAVTLVVLPYSSYIYLRSFIDALHEKAYNSFNCIFSLFIFLSTVGLLGHLISTQVGLASGLVLGFYTLGILTYSRVRMDRRSLVQT